MTKHAVYEAYCRERVEGNRLRTLQDSVVLGQGRVRRGGEELVNFASNDYLGLSQHPALKAKAKKCVEEFGAGCAASRLVTGNHPLYAAIESRLAAGKKKETALVLASGYQTNLTVLAALADRDVIGKPVTIFADKLVHHSILQGAVLSGARLQRFRHNDYAHLEALLKKSTEAAPIIVSESVFGMDGDRADLEALGKLANAHKALLYIDEAHATGVFGDDGFGCTPAHAESIDVSMGTFGKALGGFGSYVACSAILRDYLVQRCGGLIYSTALPPSVLGGIMAALEIVPSLQAERAYVLGEAEKVRRALREQGWDVGQSTTQIIPVIVGAEQSALELSETLRQKGFLVPAIRPPTVPSGTSRLRLSLSAAHKAEDITRFVEIMAALAPQYAAGNAA